MKKLFALTMLLLLAVGCSNQATPPKMGIGVVTKLSTSKGATEEKDGYVQAYVTVVAAQFDEQGKILKVKIDSVEPKGQFDTKGALQFDLEAQVLTKVEQGDNYGMKAASPIGKEAYEQFKALEDYMVGKTVQEVLAMPTYEKDPSHPAVPDVEDLKTSCTISIEDPLAALGKAYQNAK